MKFYYDLPSGVEKMFEIVILLKSWVIGQKITLTSCTHNLHVLIRTFLPFFWAKI